MGELKKWLDQDWVRIGTDGSIKGSCGTSKNKKRPDRCLPRAKANSLSKAERAKVVRAKESAGKKGKYKRSSKSNVKGPGKMGKSKKK
jgi:hypothetical protein